VLGRFTNGHLFASSERSSLKTSARRWGVKPLRTFAAHTSFAPSKYPTTSESKFVEFGL
jgi:hypothetical protein